MLEGAAQTPQRTVDGGRRTAMRPRSVRRAPRSVLFGVAGAWRAGLKHDLAAGLGRRGMSRHSQLYASREPGNLRGSSCTAACSSFCISSWALADEDAPRRTARRHRPDGRTAARRDRPRRCPVVESSRIAEITLLTHAYADSHGRFRHAVPGARCPVPLPRARAGEGQRYRRGTPPRDEGRGTRDGTQ